MKITIAANDCGGCGMYRMLFPFGALARDRGYGVTCVDSPECPEIWESDVFVLQRVSTPHVLELMQRVKATPSGPRLVMEMDDDLRRIPPNNPASKIYGTGKPATKIFEQAARLSDLLIVSTNELANLYSDLNPNICVVPNALEDKYFKVACDEVPVVEHRKRLGQVRIGYAGSSSHLGDVATIVKPLSWVMDGNDQVRLVLFGEDLRRLFPQRLWGRIEHCPQIDATPAQNASPGKNMGAIIPRYYATLAMLDLDIGLAPLERHVFNKGKSFLKALEYGMLSIPTIATRYGPYAEYGGLHPQAIITVPPDSNKVWAQAIETLVNDGKKRADLARSNREAIAKHHVLSETLDLWDDAVRSVKSGAIAA